MRKQQANIGADAPLPGVPWMAGVGIAAEEAASFALIRWSSLKP